MADAALEELRREAAKDDADIDLARGALIVARAEKPLLDVDANLRILDGYASRVRVPRGAPARVMVEALHRVLFDEEGFRGNEGDYYDPRNSLLDEVLARKTGIPITLSTVYLETGWRAGLPLTGVGMPGHFIVRLSHPDEEILVDPFHAGRLLSRRDCEALVAATTGGAAALREEHLHAVTKRQLLTRVLYNLKNVAVGMQDLRRALRWTEMVLVLNPWSVDDLRDRGALRYVTKDFRGAVADLSEYLRMAPRARDGTAVRRRLDVARRMATMEP